MDVLVRYGEAGPRRLQSLDRFDVVKVKMEENLKKLKFLTYRDLSELLGCSRTTIYYRVQDGTLPPPIKFGHLVRWPQAELEKWLDEQYESVVE